MTLDSSAVMFSFIIFLLFVSNSICTDSSPSFKIDPVNRQFLLDGDPFQYLAGEVHYFRIPHDKWDERLKQVRSLGLNSITVPIPWNFHQYDESEISQFNGNLNVVKFIETAQLNGLYVFVRIGPYIGAEWDNGGIPWWLIRSKGLGKFRSSDPKFMSLVYEWWSHLLPKLVPLLRKNNGPILMIEIEHLYGNLGICDKKYLAELIQYAKSHVGNDVILFTTDKPFPQEMRCSLSKDLYPTIDVFPINDFSVLHQFFQLQQSLANGPRVASRYDINTCSTWGQPTPTSIPAKDLEVDASFMYSINASFSFRIIHGGTNFGYWNGALGNLSVTTSYDSSAPISEGGELTATFTSLRKWVSNLKNWKTPPTEVPTIPPKVAYPDIDLLYFNSLTGFIVNTIPECWKSVDTPKTAESIHVGYGFLYYNSTFMDCGSLYIPQFADNAYIFLNGDFVGALYNQFGKIHNNTMDLSGCIGGEDNILEIIVEITGRTSIGYPVVSKGLQSNVFINNATVQEWFTCEVPIIDYDTSSKIKKRNQKVMNYIEKRTKILTSLPEKTSHAILQPSVFLAYFHIKTKPADTYLDMRGWGKGVVTINEYNIGRYWSTIGPQQTLYIPSSFLKKGSNLIMIYEFEGAPSACTAVTCKAKFSTVPIYSS